MSLSSLLEKEINGLPLEGETEDVTVNTEDSLRKVGNASMTRRGGKKGGSSSELGAMLESMNSSFGSTGISCDTDLSTVGDGTVDSRELMAKDHRSSKRGGRRHKSKSSSHNDSASSFDEHEERGRRSRTISIDD
eukprot:CAMPEP_0198141022 /NCGR_PEP_ID=MMETSP1443-20131203/4092_1 /TAXON_ID=186043 /ORGANISM="Entomoneis sp., Strain CCMP2396" /LENGTH=134 /DNA_ID=CAMNT_0043803619 /DNA_START=39 /DNA_END=443 /DNA_ORIENTATION=+